ncbi:MAG: hypothetical protein ABI587_01330 [Gemmatimonadales bacterium]
MTNHPLVGHLGEREKVVESLKLGRLPQLLLLIGPEGIGKQRFGLWIAQAVLCDGLSQPPCGTCQSCTLILGFAHPDVHWIMPVPRPKASDPDKQVEELADALAEVAAERRKDPLYQPSDGLAGHFMATSRLILRRASLTPAMGRRKVFLVAEAERLVPQEANPEAANALLKVLEEPPADTILILTTQDANRLLPTIRSRMVQLRLGRLPDHVVGDFLAERLGLSGEELKSRTRAAAGSIGKALALGEDEAKARRSADDFLAAVAGDAGGRAERALKQGPFAARGDFTAMLDALADSLGEAGRASAGLASRGSLPEMLRRPRSLESLLRAGGRVQAAREAAQGNVNPQLLIAQLADDLAEVL